MALRLRAAASGSTTLPDTEPDSRHSRVSSWLAPSEAFIARTRCSPKSVSAPASTTRALPVRYSGDSAEYSHSPSRGRQVAKLEICLTSERPSKRSAAPPLRRRTSFQLASVSTCSAVAGWKVWRPLSSVMRLASSLSLRSLRLSCADSSKLCSLNWRSAVPRRLVRVSSLPSPACSRLYSRLRL